MLSPMDQLRLAKMAELRSLQLEAARRAAVTAASVDVFALLGYEPNCAVRQAARDAGTPEADLPAMCGECPQEQFHNAQEWDVLFGGSAGGGKSLALLMEGIRACMRHPGIRVGAFRRTFPELEESLLAELGKYGYATQLGAVYDRSHHDLRFPNGSILMFRYASNLAEATIRQGGQYQLLLFDERTLIPPDVVMFLSSRLRSGDSGIPVLGVRSSCNPGGIAHGDVKKRYILPTGHGHDVILDDQGRTIRFIPARVSDNPHINTDYILSLDALPEAMRAAFRDGSWDSFAGQCFTEWNYDRHVVPRMTLPLEWLRYAGMDYGWTAPSVVLWAARDNDGRMWCYRELSMRQTPEKTQAERVLALEAGETVNLHSADPAMWGRTGSALPPASQFAIAGLGLSKADNDRLSGKLRVHTFLADAPACAYHRDLGWATCPMLHVLDATCPELVRTLPDLPYDPRRPEDVDCFIAGTLVATPDGPRRVETLSVGDLVDTPMGPQPVIAAGISGDSPLMRVEFTNGESLTGTPDHCVVTSTRGLVALEDLLPSDILVVNTIGGSEWQSTSTTTVSSTGGNPAETTTSRMARIWGRVTRLCTDRSTSTITALSPKDAMCIIGTMITTTTRRTISWLSTRSHMPAITWPRAWPIPKRTPACTPGPAQMRVGQSSGQTWRSVAPRHQRLSTRARIVESLVSPKLLGHESTAPSRVSTRGDEPTQTCGNARSAGKPSVVKPEGSVSRKPVRISAAGSYAGNGVVYQLTVDTCALYYANGFLVTNTSGADHWYDALRYLLMSVGSSGGIVMFPHASDGIVPVHERTVPAGQGFGWAPGTPQPDPELGKLTVSPFV